MFLGLFQDLRAGGVPVTFTEFFAFLRAIRAGVADHELESFYYLARCSLARDERYLDRFDRVFTAWFERLGEIEDPFALVPEEWFERDAMRFFTEEEKARIKELGGFEELMETLRKRLAEQREKHGGGSKWIGTGGSSPFGAGGYNPAGVRVGGEGGQRRAVKVWEKREFQDFDGDVELGTRQMKMALRRLRRFTREGAKDELDLDETITRTARNAGYLDIAHRAERRNRIKVLLLLDVGGSMDDHVRVVEQLFSAARTEFKHLETFYFHNCPYERMWRTNKNGREGLIDTAELLRTFNGDFRLVFVGDATMSPYEITQPGGSVEHWNEEAGAVWMQRILDHFERAVWINPEPDRWWQGTPSVQLISRLMGGRMVPLTLDGLERATAILRS